MGLLADERHGLILERLRLYGRVRATDLARDLDVSEITIRRDLNELHDLGSLSRIHGGAVRKGRASAAEDGERRVIGIVAPSSVHYYDEVLRGAESVADSLGVRLVLGVSGYAAVEVDQVHRLAELGAEGVLLATAAGDGDGAGVREVLRNLPVPVVLMERAFGRPDSSTELDHVRTDHSHGAVLAMEHLHGLGHRKFAAALVQTSTAHWLEIGIRKAEVALELAEPVEVLALPKTSDQLWGQELEELLVRGQQRGVTAYFVHNDAHAALLLDIANRRGLNVPGDISIVAYDDVTASMAAVPLTAVAPPKRAIGALALEQLIRRLGYPSDAPGPVSHQSLLPILTIRSSCAAPLRNI